METTAELLVPDAPPSVLFAHIEDLDRYPAWMRLVHRAARVDGDGERDADDPATWDVELRARVGPFARSKRLRMVRTVYEPDRRVRFERVETDGRDHARWDLDACVEPVRDGARLVMHLGYSGDLWATAVLGRILDDEIRRGRDALRRLVSDARPRA